MAWAILNTQPESMGHENDSYKEQAMGVGDEVGELHGGGSGGWVGVWGMEGWYLIGFLDVYCFFQMSRHVAAVV